MLQEQPLVIIHSQLSHSTSTGECMEEIHNQERPTIYRQRKDSWWEGIASFLQVVSRDSENFKFLFGTLNTKHHFKTFLI